MRKKYVFPTRKSFDPEKKVLDLIEKVKYDYECGSSKEFLEAIINKLFVHPNMDKILAEIFNKRK